ncbi:MAG: DUF5694 domain-containing protein [Cytophagales bacterium]|nr:DUF5694 domain-containing protein [Cytophagales bacterium]
MPNIRKVLRYGLLIIVIGFAVFLAPIFYQTHQFYYTHQYSFPEEIHAKTETEVYLIGTRHTPKDHYNQDTVYRYLEKLQPDLILLELDSGFFRGDRLKRKYTFVMRIYPFLRKYWNLEMLAATKYAKYHPKTALAPYDWEGRKEIYREVRGKKRSEMFVALFNMKTDTVKRIFLELAILYKHYRESTTIHHFNSIDNDKIDMRSAHLDYSLIPQMVLATDSLKEHHEFARKFQYYWPSRNEEMAENILRAIKLNPNKRIAILTGSRHRYLLQDLLKPKEETAKFKLLDYQGKPL